MRGLFKLIVVLAFAGGLAYAGSYAGARATVGKFLGSPTPDMGVRTVALKYQGISELPARPRAWEFRYSKASVNLNRPAKVFVTLDGKIIGTVPRDLDKRIDAWRRAREIN